MKKHSLTTINNAIKQGKKLSCLTAYDSTFAHAASEAGIDILLVGDSLGMVIQGHTSTVPVTLEEMKYHTHCVTRAKPYSLIMSDLPFMSYSKPDDALRSAAELMQSGAEIIKLEGGEWLTPIIEYLSTRGIPVCAHLGLTPQTVAKLGGYKVQGKTPEQATQLFEDAQRHISAGADMLLLECVTYSAAKAIAEYSPIPTIGIGAGDTTDAQVLVLQDMLGVTAGHTPKFSKNFLSSHDSIQAAIESYHKAVTTGEFPTAKHWFE